MLQSAIKIRPNEPDTYSQMAYFYLNKGDKENGLIFLKKGLALRSEYSLFYHNDLGVLYGQEGNYQAAAEEFKKAILIDSTNPMFFNNLGFSFVKLGLYEAAILAYEQALRLDNQLAVTYSNLGIVYAIIGNDLAEKYFKAALALSPQDLKSNFNLGLYYYEKGLKKEARLFFEKSLEIDRGNQVAQEYLRKLE